RAIRQSAGLSHGAVATWVGAGLAEEDPRFATLFLEMRAREDAPPCPTTGFLNTWFPGSNVRRLQSLGLIELTSSSAPRHLWPVQVPALIWDAMQGQPFPPNDDRFEVYSTTDAPIEFVASPTLASELSSLPALLQSGQVTALVVRGAHHNGRTTLLRLLAQQE